MNEGFMKKILSILVLSCLFSTSTWAAEYCGMYFKKRAHRNYQYILSFMNGSQRVQAGLSSRNYDVVRFLHMAQSGTRICVEGVWNGRVIKVSSVRPQ